MHNQYITQMLVNGANLSLETHLNMTIVPLYRNNIIIVSRFEHGLFLLREAARNHYNMSPLID